MKAQEWDEKKIMQAVAAAAADLVLPFMLVGASARDCLLEQTPTFRILPRRTYDVDIAVRVASWDVYRALVDKLMADYGCDLDPRFKGRLAFPGGLTLDLIPFGEIADEQGTISWPPEHDVEMGTAGFCAVLDSAISVQVGDTILRVVSFDGIVLLKFLAWHDRPTRTDDLWDIWFIFDNYVELIDEERLYAEDGIDTDIVHENEDFDWTEAGGRLVGRDLTRSTGHAGRMLLDWLDPEVTAVQDKLMMALASVVDCTEQRAIDVLRSFRKGMDETTAES